MTPHLDRYLQRIKFYKRAFMAFAVINAFSLSASLVLGVRYFAFKHSALERQTALVDKTADADRALDGLDHLRRDLAAKPLSLHSRSDELEVLTMLDRWQTERQLVQHLGVNLPDSMRLLGEDAGTNSALDLLRTRIEEVKGDAFGELKSNLVAFAGVQKELIMTGLLTLLFGFILPTLIMYYITRTLNTLRKEMQASVLDFFRTWRDTKDAHGPGAFKSPEFWLQILLLVGQYSGQLSSHPAAQVASELAFVVRQELHRAGRDHSAA